MRPATRLCGARLALTESTLPLASPAIIPARSRVLFPTRRVALIAPPTHHPSPPYGMILKVSRALASICAGLLTLSAAFAQVPANDDFANRIVLSGTLPILASGNNTSATLETGELPPYSSTRSVWWSFTADRGRELLDQYVRQQLRHGAGGLPRQFRRRRNEAGLPTTTPAAQREAAWW